MKYFAFIFSLYVLLLTIAPNVFEKQSQVEQATRQSNEDKNCNDNCSPFMSCHSCFGFTIRHIDFNMNLIETFTQKKVIMDNFVHTTMFSFSIWQPPKIQLLANQS